ncbi:MAG: hypothetical protein U0169_04490 [Polyangiaceae bacterium]
MGSHHIAAASLLAVAALGVAGGCASERSPSLAREQMALGAAVADAGTSTDGATTDGSADADAGDGSLVRTVRSGVECKHTQCITETTGPCDLTTCTQPSTQEGTCDEIEDWTPPPEGFEGPVPYTYEVCHTLHLWCFHPPQCPIEEPPVDDPGELP